ncbi:CAPZA2 [Cordylochernes scorpioides]|uniref:F-actin-capping protein subunit alpha n=1 Tax=Cordylochernes scorpioides TaxID=51811 RepID=A0ABY6LAN7_9ARAC|nr:CAPZA2 [Cordylochernes scorpioides]
MPQPQPQLLQVRIASDFLLHAPPGELNEVFNDVRVLLNNDTLLKERATSAFARYNKDQHTPVRIDGSALPALITEYNDLGGGRFYDPRSQQSFRYDHLRREPSDWQPWEADSATEPWRSALQETWTAYVADHYRHGASSVFALSRDGGIFLAACIEDHQFQPNNFWNGRWRSVWTTTILPGATSAELKGVVKVQVTNYPHWSWVLTSTRD